MAHAALIENFLESLASEKGLSKNTIQSYSLDIKQCLKITKLNIDKISSKNLNLDIEKYIASLNAKGFERSTVLRKISALGHFFNFLGWATFHHRLEIVEDKISIIIKHRLRMIAIVLPGNLIKVAATEFLELRDLIQR